MATFSYAATRRGGVAQVALAGELDMSATFQLEPELDRLLEARDVREIVLDLGDVEFVDSSGMGLLMATVDPTRDRNPRVGLVSVPPEVRRAFQIAGLDAVLPLSP